MNSARKGFSLLELMLVVFLMGILASIITPIYIQTWELSAEMQNPLPLSKAMLMLGDMDRGARTCIKSSLIAFDEEGIPSRVDSNAQAIAFLVPSVKANTGAITKEWFIYRVTDSSIIKYTGSNIDASMARSEIYYDITEPFSAECGVSKWRGSNVDAAYFNVNIYGKHMQYTLPFACIIDGSQQ